MDLTILSRMNSLEISSLVKGFPLGIQVTFRYNVEKWQKQNDTNIDSNLILPPLCSKEIMVLSDQKLTPSIPLGISFELFDVLKSTSGAMMTDYYKCHNSLNDNIRTLLVEIIIQYLITEKIVMSVSLAENIADQIQRLFPSELKVLIFDIVYIFKK